MSISDTAIWDIDEPCRACRTGARWRAASAQILQIVHQVRARDLQSRCEAEGERAEDGEDDARRMFRSGRASSAIGSGMIGASEPSSSPIVHQPRSKPPAAPASASTRLSVSSWRTMRPRPPPSATRIATRRRAVPRASSMFAMFRHAMRSTAPDSGMIVAEKIAGPTSLWGVELMLTRDSGCTVSRRPRFRLRRALEILREDGEAGVGAIHGDARLQPAGHAERRVRVIGEASPLFLNRS